MSRTDDVHQTSVRRDAWRTHLLQEQVREEMTKRRNAEHVRRAVAAGIVLGVLGGFATYLI